jgi:hypothetical protein
VLSTLTTWDKQYKVNESKENTMKKAKYNGRKSYKTCKKKTR